MRYILGCKIKGTDNVADKKFNCVVSASIGGCTHDTNIYNGSVNWVQLLKSVMSNLCNNSTYWTGRTYVNRFTNVVKIDDGIETKESSTVTSSDPSHYYTVKTTLTVKNIVDNNNTSLAKYYTYSFNSTYKGTLSNTDEVVNVAVTKLRELISISSSASVADWAIVNANIELENEVIVE